MSKTKKIIILCGMVALLVLTGCLNYFLNRTDKTDAANADNTLTYSDYFESSHADRSQSRSETVMYYEAIIESEASSAEAKANAEAELATLIANMETEQRLETLIKALGYEDCIVTVGAENINVVLKSGAMTEQEVAQVLDIVLSETNKIAANVRIKPIEA
ncbi:MAG: SpoIIIAH-like family protein [Clostridiales bacterium]|nr:SpoIIIAH-like family protein [Clostridiales bacterium]